jgi:hypothetical protein
MDNLVFCIENPGTNFSYTNPNCSRDGQYYTYWNAASKRFAEKASGTILVMLNGNKYIETTKFDSLHHLFNFLFQERVNLPYRI